MKTSFSNSSDVLCTGPYFAENNQIAPFEISAIFHKAPFGILLSNTFKRGKVIKVYVISPLPRHITVPVHISLIMTMSLGNSVFE